MVMVSLYVVLKLIFDIMTPRYIFGLAMLVLVSACEEDAVIYLPGKPVPVVYAVFNDSDSIHTVHLTRSFGARIDAKLVTCNFCH